MPKLKRLSLKQQRFVKKYVETGKPMEAALDAYDTTNRKTASSLAQQNLDKPLIQQELAKALSKAGATLESIVDNVTNIANETDIRPSADTVLKANQDLLKLYNAYPEKTSKHLSYSVKQNLTEKSFSELIELHKKQTKELEDILNS